MPAQGVHSIINDSDDFLEHYVISAIPHWAEEHPTATLIGDGQSRSYATGETERHT